MKNKYLLIVSTFAMALFIGITFSNASIAAPCSIDNPECIKHECKCGKNCPQDCKCGCRDCKCGSECKCGQNCDCGKNCKCNKGCGCGEKCTCKDCKDCKEKCCPDCKGCVDKHKSAKAQKKCLRCK